MRRRPPTPQAPRRPGPARARAHRVLLVRQAEPLEGRELELLLLLGVHDGGERDADGEHGGGEAGRQVRRRAGPGNPRAARLPLKAHRGGGARGGRGQTPPSHWTLRPDVRDSRGARERRPPAARDPPGPLSGPANPARGATAPATAGRPPPRQGLHPPE